MKYYIIHTKIRKIRKGFFKNEEYTEIILSKPIIETSLDETIKSFQEDYDVEYQYYYEVNIVE